MFEPVYANGLQIGFEQRSSHGLFFFGTRFGSLDLIQNHYSEFSFSTIKQVHGSQLVQAKINHTQLEADAHWTTTPNHALIIASADCIPVLVLSPRAVCAIHAGWRGVKNEIIISSINTISSLQLITPSTQVAIGPHIRQASFEVDLPLGLEFQQQAKFYANSAHNVLTRCELNKEKAYIDLNYIARAQLRLCAIADQNVFDINFDTVGEMLFASYRRDQGAKNRNLSFVARLG